jgi:hypothetical protein
MIIKRKNKRKRTTSETNFIDLVRVNENINVDLALLLPYTDWRIYRSRIRRRCVFLFLLFFCSSSISQFIFSCYSCATVCLEDFRQWSIMSKKTSNRTILGIVYEVDFDRWRSSTINIANKIDVRRTTHSTEKTHPIRSITMYDRRQVSF